MAELALYGGNVAGLFDEVSAHGVAGVMRGVVPCAGQVANFVPNRVDHTNIQPAGSQGNCICRKKQRRRFPFFIVPSPLPINNIVLNGSQALTRNRGLGSNGTENRVKHPNSLSCTVIAARSQIK